MRKTPHSLAGPDDPNWLGLQQDIEEAAAQGTLQVVKSPFSGESKVFLGKLELNSKLPWLQSLLKKHHYDI